MKFVSKLKMLQSFNILLAEDNLINQKLTIKLLERLGCKLDIAINGLEVLEMIKHKSYDIILMDIRMPDMDGVEATKALTKIYGEERPVIIAVTADVFKGARERYLAEGLDDYMAKPIDAERFQAMLLQWVDKIAQKRESIRINY